MSDNTPARTIIVVGSASEEVTPDEASLSFSAHYVNDSREKAYNFVNENFTKLRTVLDNHNVDKSMRRGDGVRVQRYWDHKKGNQKQWQASGTLTVLFRQDVERIGALVDDVLNKVEGVELVGPAWNVSATHPARLELCKQAVREAKVRAQAYAEAAGVVLGELVELREANAMGMRALGMGGMAFAGAAGANNTQLAPGVMEVESSVELSFAIGTSVSNNGHSTGVTHTVRTATSELQNTHS